MPEDQIYMADEQALKEVEERWKADQERKEELELFAHKAEELEKLHKLSKSVFS